MASTAKQNSFVWNKTKRVILRKNWYNHICIVLWQINDIILIKFVRQASKLKHNFNINKSFMSFIATEQFICTLPKIERR